MTTSTIFADLVGDVRAMLSRSKASSYALARAIHGLHTSAPESFRQLIRDRLIARRRAYYLRQVGRAIELAGLSDEVLGQIGWTKLTLIAERLTPDTADELISLAKIETVSGLRSALTKLQASPRRHLVLSLSTEDYDLIVAALLKRGAVIQENGIRNAGSALKSMIHELAGEKVG